MYVIPKNIHSALDKGRLKDYCVIVLSFCRLDEMAGPGVFHVEFGINETILTRALERGQFELAEKIIREAANPSFLDEGK